MNVLGEKKERKKKNRGQITDMGLVVQLGTMFD